MATMAENVIAAGSETGPPMLEKGMYDSWKTRIMLYIRGKKNDEMLRDSVENGPYKFKSEITTKDKDGVTDIRREERLEDLKGDDKLRYDSDIKVVNILHLGMLVDIYTLINHYQTAKEIWDRVKELMEGIEMTKKERESMLYDEFDKFTFEPRESIHSYYLRYVKLINDMNMIHMSMTPMQINTKFVNHLQPEWSRFVTAAKQARDLHSITFDQLTQAIIQNGQVVVQNVQGRQSQGYASNAGNNQASGAWVINVVGNTGENQPMEKMLLAQEQEARFVLDEKQQDFLADSLEDTDDCEELQLQATANFKADHVDAYDSDCDDEATANAIFRANLSPVVSLNDDTVAPRYDSETLFEVPHYDTYHDFDVLNSNIQELGYIENIVSTNESYVELKGNSDVISYTDYMLTIGRKSLTQLHLKSSNSSFLNHITLYLIVKE
ncbi:hypothetical protein Tco_0701471 [Tanacetum coccineum]